MIKIKYENCLEIVGRKHVMYTSANIITHEKVYKCEVIEENKFQFNLPENFHATVEIVFFYKEFNQNKSINYNFSVQDRQIYTNSSDLVIPYIINVKYSHITIYTSHIELVPFKNNTLFISGQCVIFKNNKLLRNTVNELRVVYGDTISIFGNIKWLIDIQRMSGICKNHFNTRNIEKIPNMPVLNTIDNNVSISKCQMLYIIILSLEMLCIIEVDIKKLTAPIQFKKLVLDDTTNAKYKLSFNENFVLTCEKLEELLLKLTNKDILIIEPNFSRFVHDSVYPICKGDCNKLKLIEYLYAYITLNHKDIKILKSNFPCVKIYGSIFASEKHPCEGYIYIDLYEQIHRYFLKERSNH